MADQREIGTLVVVVLKARNLKDDHFYKQVRACFLVPVLSVHGNS